MLFRHFARPLDDFFKKKWIFIAKSFFSGRMESSESGVVVFA